MCPWVPSPRHKPMSSRTRASSRCNRSALLHLAQRCYGAGIPAGSGAGGVSAILHRRCFCFVVATQRLIDRGGHRSRGELRLSAVPWLENKCAASRREQNDDNRAQNGPLLRRELGRAPGWGSTPPLVQCRRVPRRRALLVDADWPLTCAAARSIEWSSRPAVFEARRSDS